MPEICALSDTLILDEDGLYDPTHFNDRFLLGLKGTMSEAELHVLRARLRGGLLNKARRGELRCSLPVDLVNDAGGRVVLDSDQSALHNPWYAGAYAFGRGRWRKRPDGRTRHERLPQEEWQVLILDAHPGYISWTEHQRIAQCLRAGTRGPGYERRGEPPREGPALLQGRVVCGLCGSRMHVHYNTRRSGELITNYVCAGRTRLFGDLLCQSLLGTQVDAAVSELLVAVSASTLIQ